MRLAITARHMDMTDGLKTHVEQSLAKIRNHFDKVIDADVVLSVEKRHHIAEMTLHANGLRIHGKEATEDMYASIDAVIGKLDKQIAKYKNRIKRYKVREAEALRDYSHNIVEISQEDQADGEAATPHRVVHHEKLSMRPLSVDEAAMQLELMDEPFIVFSNADTQHVNVLYKRDDGTYSLIEPQF